MAVYEYRCPEGHITELVLPMADEKPESVPCEHALETGAATGEPTRVCAEQAARVWQPWAATIYHGAGTYTNDYKLKYDRKRRKMPGDGMPLPAEAAITRAEGAEYAPPKNLPGGMIPRG